MPKATAEYQADHKRVRKVRGSPRQCQVCGTTNTRTIYDWANLTGKYDDVRDYKRMCRKCHQAHDKINERKQGEGGSSARLTTEQVLKIRSLYQPALGRLKPFSQFKLAEMFGVSRTTIQCILEKRTWRHI